MEATQPRWAVLPMTGRPGSSGVQIKVPPRSTRVMGPISSEMPTSPASTTAIVTADGVVDLRDVLYFVSTTGLFLMLAVGAVSRERLGEVLQPYLEEAVSPRGDAR